MKYHLDGKKMVSKEETHAYLQEVFAFPAHYGKNLDALYDCLTELDAAEVELLHSDEMKAALGKYGEQLLRVFRDAEINIECK